MYQLFTDTDTDITPKEAEKYGYKLISMPYIIDGVETYPYVDFDEFDAKAFYDTLRKGDLPSTCALSPLQYKEYFEPALAEGKDIIYVHFSAAMSGTFNSLNIAWRELSEKYPERKLHLIDTKFISIGSLCMVREIGEMALRGAQADEIVGWAEREVDRFAVYFFADDLKFFARSGRVSNLAAFMGALIGIRPIISVGDDGKMGSIGKAKGRRGALRKLLDYVDTLGDDIKSYPIIVGHADALPLAEELVRELRAKYGEDLRCDIVPVNPTIGSHCGPDTVGVCFHAKHR